MRTIIILGLLLCACVVQAASPAQLEARIAAAISSNDWAAVTNAYDGIDWRRVRNEVAYLKRLSALMRNKPALRELRRDIKSKVLLLKSEDEAPVEDTVVTLPVEKLVLDRKRVTEKRVTPDVPALDVWKAHYDARRDMDPTNRVSPMPGTTLDMMRKGMEKSNDPGAVSNYNSAIERALYRRRMLNRGAGK